MVLVDTSVWVDHFRRGVPELVDALSRNAVLIHPIVIGELAAGNLGHRARVLEDLRRLPLADEASFDECLHFIEAHRLHGRGLGWNDIQLLASARLSRARLWTIDKRLREVAEALSRRRSD
jgi:predicted nucleic acid-binding protein